MEDDHERFMRSCRMQLKSLEYIDWITVSKGRVIPELGAEFYTVSTEYGPVFYIALDTGFNEWRISFSPAEAGWRTWTCGFHVATMVQTVKLACKAVEATLNHVKFRGKKNETE